MKLYFAFISCVLTAIFANAQTLDLKVKTRLSDTVSETSGLIHLNGRFFTHEDSGGEPNLYEIDTSNGSIIRVYKVKGASNIDWEDLTADDSFVYIGDFGNNAGMRKDLCIYKLRINDILNGDTQNYAQKILFNYEGQNDFSTKTYQTNYDAEAMVAIGNQLYVFSKNWGNFKSYVYPLSKLPGSYSMSVLDSFNAQGLITGATYSKSDTQLVLCGYTFNCPFMIQMKFNNGLIGVSQFKRTEFPLLGVVQMEAICRIDIDHYLISCEKNTNDAQLYILSQLKVQNWTHIEESMELLLYPNPAANILTIKSSSIIKKLKIFNNSEQLLLDSTFNLDSLKEIDISCFPSGRYLFVFEDQLGRTIAKSVLK
jgi:hypothetical protein